MLTSSTKLMHMLHQDDGGPVSLDQGQSGVRHTHYACVLQERRSLDEPRGCLASRPRIHALCSYIRKYHLLKLKLYLYAPHT